MKHVDVRLRISLYFVVVAAGGALVTWGILTQDVVDAILPVVGGLLAVGGGATSLRNITPEVRAESPELMEWMLIARQALPQILDELARLRGDVAARNAADAALPAPQLVEYVPDRAPWLPAPEAYVGEHRAE
ncbi:hypothetical protein K3888_13355 [Dietzia aurantiaca]|uniref:hypothetical protein n=1 Tax=Dietzia aurantiaca TaxID=983873 RepID=UPI001E603614|nr:hypothetical protein [Dietzia aurantiaca]MCD2263687.1 hypothetical protein [Dietzia aurantiaca]